MTENMLSTAGVKWLLCVVSVAATAFLGAPAAAGTANQIVQYGVTISFNGPHEVGQFSNGDYWVVPDGDGKVTLTAMTPAFDGTHHGWEINPADTTNQGFDTRIYNFDASRVPALPYDASPGESVVKTVSVDITASNPRPALQTAVVLTVLAAAPPDNGATVFRPPYFGAAKPLYRTSDLHPERLPSLSSNGVSNVPTLAWVENRFQRVWLDHKSDWTGRAMHPAENMQEYGSGICVDTGQGALRLMLDDPVADKMAALIRYVQLGIDLYHIRLGGMTYSPNGGHNHGRKLPVAFAGALLEHDGMKQIVFDGANQVYHEDLSTYYSPTAKMVLWGQHAQSAAAYWNCICNDSGSKTIRDPYGYIDGGQEPGGSYQYCCNSSTWKGTALSLHLMPELRETWNSELFLEYEDRWVNFGAWTQPDPYVQDCANRGALDTDPSDGIGRWPERHGINANSGSWGSAFANSMWSVYRPGNSAGLPAVVPYGAEFDNTIEVTLESSPRTPGCEIRYTLDGTEPTEISPLYSGPFTLNSTTTVRARAFKDSLYPSAVHRVTFVYTGLEPRIVAWRVVGQHGGQEVTTTVGDGYIEPRVQGLRTVRIEFNKDVDPGTVGPGAITITGDESGDLSARIAAVTAPVGNVVQVTLDPALPDGEWVTVAVTAALHTASGLSFTGDLDIRLGSLAGDADGSGAVSDADVLMLRNKAGTPLDGDTARYDVDGSGKVTGADMRAARRRIGGQVPRSTRTARAVKMLRARASFDPDTGIRVP